MNAIAKQLETLKNEKRTGLMTHVVIGYPTLERTVSLAVAMEKAGADFLELQIPFSDPLADGPTIMKACEQALAQGVKVQDAFHIACQLSTKITIPLLFMAYYNTVFSCGVEQFCRAAVNSGVSGLIVPDMPLDEEENEHFLATCKRNNMFSIRVLSPASTVERMRKNAVVAEGFIYCTARQGITDAQKTLDLQIAEYLKMVKKTCKMPLAVGFGISSRERVELIRDVADIVVVGSAVIDTINSSPPQDMENSVTKFLTSLQV